VFCYALLARYAFLFHILGGEKGTNDEVDDIIDWGEGDIGDVVLKLYT
jgi:hypothetical protein